MASMKSHAHLWNVLTSTVPSRPPESLASSDLYLSIDGIAFSSMAFFIVLAQASPRVPHKQWGWSKSLLLLVPIEVCGRD